MHESAGRLAPVIAPAREQGRRRGQEADLVAHAVRRQDDDSSWFYLGTGPGNAVVVRLDYASTLLETVQGALADVATEPEPKPHSTSGWAGAE